MGLLPDIFRDVAQLLGNEPGWIAAALAVSLVGLLVRLYRTRKRLTHTEEFNSKIGIVPFGILDDTASANRLLKVVDRISIVVINIRNSGKVLITSDDLDDMHISFDGRYIVDFRSSGAKPSSLFDLPATDEGVKDQLDESWLVTRTTVRDGMTRKQLRDTLPGCLGMTEAEELSDDEKTARRRLRMKDLKLRPGNSFDLVVCLRTDDLLDTTTPPRSYAFTPTLEGSGKVINGAAPPRRPSPTQLWASAVIVLATLLVVSYLVRPQSPVYCGTGPMKMVGSSAFAPTVMVINDGYRADCADVQISTAMDGSLEGIRDLQQSAPADRPRLLAFSDGRAVDPADPQLQSYKVAVLIYAVVINRSTGVQNLTSEQIRQINSGAVRNWSQLGGADLPIRIVGRDSSSGSRQAFEIHVLQSAEAPVSSNSCTSADRVPTAPVIRCERSTTAELLGEVDRVPGAIGYADASSVAKYPNAVRVRVDNAEPTEEYLQNGYQFWTIEYAYTEGVPPGGGLVDRYIGYLSTDAAARRLREASYIPCVRSDGSIETLCQQDR